MQKIVQNRLFIGYVDGKIMPLRGQFELCYLDESFRLNQSLHLGHQWIDGEGTLGAQMYLESILRYYSDVDVGNNEKVRNFFSEDAPVSMIEVSTDGELSQVRSNSGKTTYARADHVITGKDEIDSFYSPTGRTLKGKHSIDFAIAGVGFGMTEGRFEGTAGSNNNPISLSFSDVFFFGYDSTRCIRRNTYISATESELLAIRGQREPVEDPYKLTVSIPRSRGNMSMIEDRNNPTLTQNIFYSSMGQYG